MRTCFLLCAFGCFVWVNAAPAADGADRGQLPVIVVADSDPEENLILGPAETDSAQPKITPNIEPPPKPGVFDLPEDKKNVPPTKKSAPPKGPRAAATALIVEAQQLLSEGRYEDAIAVAGEAMALDPSNASAFKKVRANAYQLSGRFDEALADSNPLEVTVGSPLAELKSGINVVGRVTGGTKLLVSESKDNWLKVASIDGRALKWAWIHKRDVAVGQPRRQSVLITPEPLRPRPDYRRYGRRPGRDYGRGYYDYWRHVPRRYWRYLP